MEGTNADSDRGHVYFSGRPLCAETTGGSTTWDINASNVVCRMLGFSSTTTSPSTDGCPYTSCPVGIAYAMSGFKCTGSETHIIDCPHDQAIPDHCGTNGETNGNGASSNDIVGIECGRPIMFKNCCA